MEAAGVDYVSRMLGHSVIPSVELSKTGGNNYFFKATSVVKNWDTYFESGKEFDEETADGRFVKCVMTVEGNKMTTQRYGDPPTPSTTIIREFGEKELIVTLKVNDITSVRKYRVAE